MNKLTKKIISLFTSIFLIISLLFINNNPLNVKALNDSYYIVGSFNNYLATESYKLDLNSDNNYEIILNIKNDMTQFYITDKDTNYKDNGLNYVINKSGDYKILFNPNKFENDSYIKIEDAPQTNFYVLGPNGFELNEATMMTYVSKGKYKYEVVTDDYSLFYISDGNKEYRNINGDDYLIPSKGKYEIEFNYTLVTHLCNINKLEEDNSYYVLGSFNNYVKNDKSLMELNKENEEFEEYSFYINNTSLSQFYIKNQDIEYKDVNNKNFILKDNISYEIYFSPTHKYENNSNVYIKESSYYILCEDNNWEINQSYMLDRNANNNKVYEYFYHIIVDDTFQFIISDGNHEYKDNKGNFIIDEKGEYNIYFSPSKIYDNDKNVTIKKEDKPISSYYLLGNFNNYEINDDYKLEYNNSNDDFVEYQITSNISKNDSFYISDGKNNYKDPSNKEFKVDITGTYKILFSSTYDYGNNYHVHIMMDELNEDEEKVIEIKTANDVIDLINQCNTNSYNSNLRVEIVNDIDMNEKEINPISIFAGTLNGNFNKIYNFKVNDSLAGNDIGFIRKLVSTGVINNLIIDYELKANNSKTSIGGIVGINYGLINNSMFAGKVNGIKIVGGIAGSNEKNGKINNCVNEGYINGQTVVGGICGANYGDIKGSYNVGHINQNRFMASEESKIIDIGGICGYNQGSIYNSYNKGNIGQNQIGTFVGGIAGSSIGEITNCYNDEDVLGNNYVGGIVGYYAEYSKNKNDDEFNALIKYIEDILFGKEEETPNVEKPSIDKNKFSQIKYCYNTSNIKGDSNVGGIVGYASNENIKIHNKESFNISICYNLGNITSTNNYVGGIVGQQNHGMISDCFNGGLIESTNKNYVGGIAGSSSDTIKNSFSITSIRGNNNVGGIVGYGKKIMSCYSVSSISADGIFIGSIAGEADVSGANENIKNNYFTTNGINAIDNVNYKNKAEEINVKDLACLGSLSTNLDYKAYIAGSTYKTFPMLKSMLEIDEDVYLNEAFKKEIKEITSFACRVSFLDEDENIIKIVKVPYGYDINLNDIPSPIKKDDHFAMWEDFNKENITSDINVHIVYKEIITSISSDKTIQPKIIVEGKFSKETTITINDVNKDYLGNNSMYKLIGSYKIDLKDNNGPINKDNIYIRVLLENDYKNPHVAIIKNNNPIFIDYKIEGNYICFDNLGADEFIIVDEELYNFNNPKFVKIFTISLVSTVALIGIITALIIIILNKKKKNKAN